MLNWIKCSDWGELPLGDVMVVIETEGELQHHMAKVTRNSHGRPLIIVSNSFHFDYNAPTAYATFNHYEEKS